MGALGFLSESTWDGLLGVILDVVDPEKNHRIYISTVSVGDVTFHCHSAVHEKQVQLGMIRVVDGCVRDPCNPSACQLVFSLKRPEKAWHECCACCYFHITWLYLPSAVVYGRSAPDPACLQASSRPIFANIAM